MLRITAECSTRSQGSLPPLSRAWISQRMTLVRLPRAFALLEVGTAVITSAEDDLARGCRIRRHAYNYIQRHGHQRLKARADLGLYSDRDRGRSVGSTCNKR